MQIQSSWVVPALNVRFRCLLDRLRGAIESDSTRNRQKGQKKWDEEFSGSRCKIRSCCFCRCNTHSLRTLKHIDRWHYLHYQLSIDKLSSVSHCVEANLPRLLSRRQALARRSVRYWAKWSLPSCDWYHCDCLSRTYAAVRSSNKIKCHCGN